MTLLPFTCLLWNCDITQCPKTFLLHSSQILCWIEHKKRHISWCSSLHAFWGKYLFWSMASIPYGLWPSAYVLWPLSENRKRWINQLFSESQSSLDFSMEKKKRKKKKKEITIRAETFLEATSAAAVKRIHQHHYKDGCNCWQRSFAVIHWENLCNLSALFCLQNLPLYLTLNKDFLVCVAEKFNPRIDGAKFH